MVRHLTKDILLVIKQDVSIVYNELKDYNFIDPDLALNYNLKPWEFIANEIIFENNQLITGVFLISLHKIIQIHEWDKDNSIQYDIIQTLHKQSDKTELMLKIYNLILEIVKLKKGEDLFPLINKHIEFIVNATLQIP